MVDVLLVPLFGWPAWSVWNSGVLLASGMSPQPDTLLRAYVHGVFRPRIIMHPSLAHELTREEWTAVWLHERGHIKLGHLRRNAVMMVALPFWPRSPELATEQELEADLFVHAHGCGPALAHALRRMSIHPFDMYRAARLEAMAKRPSPEQGTCSPQDNREG